MAAVYFWKISYLLLATAFPITVRSTDTDALLSLKSSIDPLNVLQWRNSTNVCQWEGIKECLNGRVTKLIVENFNLGGILDGESINQLDQLRVLSFKQNSFSGQIPEFPGLANLKSLFLNHNRFSGAIPVGLSALRRLKVIVLSGNRLSGEIPHSLADVRRLYVLCLQDNELNGTIPPFNQTSLSFLNVSNNRLSGEIPVTVPLQRLNESSFTGNVNLCGKQIGTPCNVSPSSPRSAAPETRYHHKKNRKIILITVLSICGFAILCIAMVILLKCLRKRSKGEDKRSKVVARGVEEGTPSSGVTSGGGIIRDDNNKRGALWEEGGEGLGNLLFLGPGDQQMNYNMEDLLKASAETLGRGTMGSTYKALMESGYIVTVKRLKDARYPRMDEFRRHIEIVGKLVHPNLVPLRAYFQAKEERLLVYDYFPNGSLFSLVHGTRAAGGSKPLHWTSCLKIAEDLATGLVYIHQNPGLTHGNLKSTNVLMGSDFESCLTDYGLTTFRNSDSLEESSSASSLFYRAPECRDVRRPLTQQADVYSYGVLLLELLTGKTPFQDLVQAYGSDIPRWVRSVREDETESGDDLSSGNEGAYEEKLNSLLNIAMSCISLSPEARPLMRDVLRMVKEVRGEAAHVSSNSSDHSPGRWSDTVQSLTPRGEHLSI